MLHRLIIANNTTARQTHRKQREKEQKKGTQETCSQEEPAPTKITTTQTYTQNTTIRQHFKLYADDSHTRLKQIDDERAPQATIKKKQNPIKMQRLLKIHQDREMGMTPLRQSKQ